MKRRRPLKTKRNPVNPRAITNYHRKMRELEEFFLFAMAVQGKESDTQAKALDRFLQPAHAQGMSPFEYIQDLVAQGSADDPLSKLKEEVKASHLGQWGRFAHVFSTVAGPLWSNERGERINLRNCTVHDLESVNGCGPKTARFFMLHSRPGARCAALDTHVLKDLRERGVSDVPKSTPPIGRKYDRLEREWLRIAEENGLRTTEQLAAHDLAIWQSFEAKKRAKRADAAKAKQAKADAVAARRAAKAAKR